VELPIPTYYGDEICRVNGMKYAWNVIVAAARARLQNLGLFYDRKYDCAPPNASLYFPKFSYTSPHTLALERVPAGSRVLDIGCAGGYMGAALAREKHCSVDGVDAFPAVEPGLSAFWLHDLNSGLPDLPFEEYDVVLMLDVLEHLSKPEAFLEDLRRALKLNPRAEVIMLALGYFNYGRRGILDLTHTRLFTFASFRRAVLQAGFDVVETQGVPGPFPLALGDNFLSRTLLAVNRGLIRISRGLFSYQIFMRLRLQPSLELLLHHAEEETRQRVELMRTAGSEH
jgi:SAM-dependent methyltransferase